MIPNSFITDLLSRVDIVEVINKAVPLKKAGKNYMACCPFHKEKTPSFSVSPQKQFYKCFGCGEAGSAIGFVMKYEGVSYPEAIKKLAATVGMVVPEDPGAQKKNAKTKTLADLMDMARQYYCDSLKINARVIDYLRKRGITGETAARFGLGFSPEGWQNLKDVFGDKYEGSELEDVKGCGLVIHNDAGRVYDRFRGRLMFPIRNPRGQVIGFGARTLNGDEHPKYLNSPETAIYRKGHEIYGLFEGHNAIRKNGRAIVCEGYMDVIQLSQAGFAESVAALGTSITEDHVKKLLRITDKVYFSFDGDSAGQHALRRAMESAIAVIGDSQEVRFVTLPEEHDPDSLIKERGAQAFEEEIAKSLTLTQFFVKSVSEGKDMATGEGRSRFLNEAKPLVVSMRNAPLLRTQLLTELAMIAHVNPDELAATFGIVQPRPAVQAQPQKPRWGNGWRNGNRPRVPERIETVRAGDKVDRLLQLLLSFPALAVEYSSRIEEEFVDRESDIARQILEVWRCVTAGEEPITQPHVLMENLNASPYASLYRRLMAGEFVIQTSEETARVEIDILFDRLELERVKAMLDFLVRNPTDMNQIKALNDRRLSLDKKIRETSKQNLSSLA